MNLIRTTFLLLTVGFVASCGTLKPAARFTNLTNSAAENDPNPSSVQFLEVKSIQSPKTVTNQISNSSQFSAEITAKPVDIVKTTKPTGIKLKSAVDAEAFSMLQIKYAIALDLPAESITNITLYQTIEEWYGTRYRFGGTTKRGVDCSSLMQHIYLATYGKTIPRTAITQYKASKRITKEELQEGDLIFFHTTRSGISHVGLYLGNGRFVHASSSRGVVINHIDESYYAKAYRGCGRFEENFTASE